MLRPGRLLLVVALIAFLGVVARLDQLEDGGPSHADLVLAGNVPATLYLPSTHLGMVGAPLPDPPPTNRRSPAVVLAHGFSADRLMMSSLARRLAANGYVVLAIDFRGHGNNRTPFPSGRGRADFLESDLAPALELLRQSPYVDPARIVVMGHSMGAGAVLDFATREPGIAGVVAISGGWQLVGRFAPPNVLFIVAARDPESIRTSAARLTARLAGVERAEPGRSYGTVADRHAVRLVEVPGEDHLTILWSYAATREIIAWLDGVCGVSRGGGLSLEDPRRRTAALGLALAVLLLMGIGQLVGRLAPPPPVLPESGSGVGLVALVLASLGTMPLIAGGSPFPFLGLEVGDLTITHMALTGLTWLVTLRLLGRLDWAGWRPVAARSIGTGLLGFLAIYVLLTPLFMGFHRMTPTPERLGAMVLATIFLLPFFVAFELGIRRGGTARAAGAALAGRALVIAVALVGVRVGVMPFVVTLMLPTFAILFVLFEVVAAAAYATSRNLIAIATIEAAWLAWSTAALMPIRW